MKKRLVGKSPSERAFLKLAERSAMLGDGPIEISSLKFRGRLNIESAIEDYQRRGWGTTITVSDGSGTRKLFSISKIGKEVAEEISAARYARSLTGRLAHFRWDAFNAIAAAVSAIAACIAALFSYLALVKHP